MPNNTNVTILPQALDAFSFNHVVLRGQYGSIMHKTVHEDLRELDFISTQSFICYLIKGRERFCDEDGDTITLTDGDLIAVPKGVRLQSDFVSQDGPLQAILIFCSDHFLRKLVEHRALAEMGTPPKSEYIAAHPSLTAFMENMIHIYEPLSVNEELVHSKMTELMFLLDTLHQGDFLGALYVPDTNRPRSIQNVMRLYKGQNFSSKEIAELSGRSIASFNRDFRKTYGTSYTQWKIGQKLERSCEMLEHTEKSITEIAFENGYESVSYFIEQFGKAYGTSPFKYRKCKNP